MFQSILFGCDEGLFHLSPSTTSVSSKADMKKIEGFTSMYQLTPLNKSTVLAIEGSKHRVISFSSSSVSFPITVSLIDIKFGLCSKKFVIEYELSLTTSFSLVGKN